MNDHNINRRTFLAGTAAAAVAGSLLSKTAFAADAPAPRLPHRNSRSPAG